MSGLRGAPAQGKDGHLDTCCFRPCVFGPITRFEWGLQLGCGGHGSSYRNISELDVPNVHVFQQCFRDAVSGLRNSEAVVPTP